jgi:triosephosphate isomerase
VPSSVFTEGLSNSVYIGVSTKMYLGYQTSLRWLEQVREVVDARPTLTADGLVQLFVMPSFPLLESARRILSGSPVRLGAQNCGWGDGPLTGEVSAGMLVELGVSLVEVGHAERRLLFGEDTAVVARKMSTVMKAGLTPLLCIGEDRKVAPDEAALFCATQVRAALGDLVKGDRARLSSVLLAYEPLWAIGAPAPADPAYVDRVVAVLRTLLRERFGTDTGIIYGGSAGPGLLPRLGSVDGLFLGRFAHDPANLGSVIDEALSADVRVID